MSKTYTNNNQVITAFYNGKFISKGYCNTNLVFYSDLVTLTINPDPSDATIGFNAPGNISQDGKSIVITRGTPVQYLVSKETYVASGNTITVNNNQTINVILRQSQKNAGLVSDSNITKVRNARLITENITVYDDAGLVTDEIDE